MKPKNINRLLSEYATLDNVLYQTVSFPLTQETSKLITHQLTKKLYGEVTNHSIFGTYMMGQNMIIRYQLEKLW